MFFTLHMCCCNIGQLLKLSVHCNQHCWYSTVLIQAESLCVFIYIYIYIYNFMNSVLFLECLKIYIYILAGATACGGLTCFVLYTLAPSKSHITHLCNSCLKAPGGFRHLEERACFAVAVFWDSEHHFAMTV